LRVSNELRKAGVSVLPSGVRSIWLRHGLTNFKDRLKTLEAKVAEQGIILTEAQVAAPLSFLSLFPVLPVLSISHRISIFRVRLGVFCVFSCLYLWRKPQKIILISKCHKKFAPLKSHGI